MDHNLDRTDDEDIFSENCQTDFLQDLETKKWVRDRLKHHYLWCGGEIPYE